MLNLNGKKTARAFQIFREEPVKFTVQHKAGKKAGLGPLEHSVFWSMPLKAMPSSWDTKWEIMSRSYAMCFCNDERYEFEGGRIHTALSSCRSKVG